MTAAQSDEPVIAVGGKSYGGWMEFRLRRGLDHCAGGFSMKVSERWPGQDTPWQIAPFDACMIAIGGDLALTGYVDRYEPEYSDKAHGVRIAGRSKTGDIIDCSPEIEGGQYNGFKLDQIARAICKPFGIDVVVAADVGDAFVDATLERCETAFDFLERLCRLRGVLACDDARGRLVLTSAGAASASGALRQGDNILAAKASLTADRRFSKYIIRAQAGMAWGGDDAEDEIVASATDGDVPRYRPHASIAESSLDTAMAKRRALWQARWFAARSTLATITLRGWRQPDGRLWDVNETIPVWSPWLKIDRVMLIAAVDYILDAQGRRTELTVGPVEAWTPDPGQVHLRKTKGGGAAYWDVKSIK